MEACRVEYKGAPAVQTAFVDITERKAAEERLKAGEERFRVLFESAKDPIFIKDEKRRYVMANPATVRIFGAERGDISGLSDDDLVETETAAKIRREDDRVLSGNTLEGEHVIVVRGEPVTFHCIKTPLRDASGEIVGLCGIARDLTHVKHLENQLRQSHKMEALGRLAGGVAHDFNNILGIILGNAELSLHESEESSPVRSNLAEIRRACMRAKEVVRQILSFSRSHTAKKRPVRLSEIIGNAGSLIRASIPTSVRIEQQVAEGGPSVKADPEQLQQVLLNLCANAAQAMENGGELTIGADAMILAENGWEGFADVPAGAYAHLWVKDTGGGIDPAIIDRIFDPYFTTRPVGDGAGLGLSVVHGVVRNHGGALKVESDPGKGTVMHVLFPEAAEEDGEVAKGPGENSRGRRILLVDDEPALAAMNRKMLEKMGHTVLDRTNPKEALSDFRQDPAAYNIVLTDMTMPQMSGEELVAEVRKIRPDIPIIFCTGFGDRLNDARVAALGVSAFLKKPYGMAELGEALKKAAAKRAG